MSYQDEVVKDILIKAMEGGYIPKRTLTHREDAFEKNIESITHAYKEIYKVVNDPID